jgi:hypothetical protein
MTLTDKLAIPEKYIPFGHYCYETNRQEPCPFWESKQGEYPEHEDGYCHYMGVSDWDLNEDSGGSAQIIFCADDKSIEGKTIDELTADEPDDIDPISGKKIHFTSSLIWDQVKECEINMREPDETIITQYNSETKETTSTTSGEIRKANNV